MFQAEKFKEEKFSKESHSVWTELYLDDRKTKVFEVAESFVVADDNLLSLKNDATN